MTDPNKAIGSGAPGADQTDSLRSASSQGPGRILYSAVVEEVISSPNRLSDSIRERYGSGGPRQAQNSSHIDKMPRGSIIATIVSDQSAKVNSSPVIFFPMFSHLNLPIKPGEQVWVMYQKVDSPSGVGFWISRRVGPSTVDDPNYTHLDRVLDIKTTEELDSSERFYGASSSGGKRTFGSGGGKRKANQTLPGASPYKNIVENAESNLQFTGEPVPGFAPRCSDLTLLGSNNTRIVLGEDRPGPIENDSSITEMGTIDIVAGVGREGSGNEAISTENTRGYSEADLLSESRSETEGDPNFATDLSRVYVSMKTSGDSNFAINTPSIGSTNGADSGEGPYIVVKSTHPRVIAKSDGSIKIVHESGSSIVMDSSGNVEIVTNGKLSMGTSANNLEPFVRGETLKNALDEFAEALASLVVLTPAGPSSVLGSGITNPGTSLGTFSLDVAAFKAAVAASLSEIIEGE